MSTEMTVISLPDAAQRLHVSPKLLIRMVENGTLISVKTTDGQTLIPLSMVEKMAKEMALRDKIWNKVKRFEDETISVSDSVKELGINPDLIYSCIEKGYIRAIDPPSKGGRSRTRRLNKADVAYVAALSKHGGGRGHRLFTPDTIPPHAVAQPST